jgi:hypothetical protein
VVEADSVAVDGKPRLGIRGLAEADGGARPIEIVDRLATLARSVGHTVPAERPQQLPVEGQRAVDVGDDQVDVMDSRRAHGGRVVRELTAL